MKQMKQIYTGLLAVLLGGGMLLRPVWAEESEPIPDMTDPTADTLFIELDLTEGDPLEVLKQKVIENRAAEGLLDLETVSIPESQITVDHFDPANILREVNVCIDLASAEEGNELEIGYSFTEKVMVDLKTSTAPQLLLTSDRLTLTVNDEFDPMSCIAWLADDKTAMPVVTLDSNLDLEHPGVYHVDYSVRDSEGNKTSARLLVEVRKKSLTGFQTVSLEDAHIADDGSIEAMFAAINAIRQANGIAPFAMADMAGLSAAAVRAQEASYYLSHSRPDGSSYITALDEAGVAYCHYPHEVLVAYGNSVETNLNWWMNSPGHSSKLMNPGMDIIAIGHYGGVWVGMIY